MRNAAFSGAAARPDRDGGEPAGGDHRISIKTIGNKPNDPVADDVLVHELTTPAPRMMGTCTADFS